MRFAFVVLGFAVRANGQCDLSPYQPEIDHLAIHYDNAPDRDDGHSAALDRTLIDSTHDGCRNESFFERLTPVTGTYGFRTKYKKPNWFKTDSDAVMEAAWGDCGGWISAHVDLDKAVTDTAARWVNTLSKGGRIFVKEGGPSEFTADVVQKIVEAYPSLNFDPSCQVTVVQHSNWNEKQTYRDYLNYVKDNTNYVRISDANDYLKVVDDDEFFNTFKTAALASEFGDVWQVAFDYYSVTDRGRNKGRSIVDASDSGELMEIMGLGQMSLSACMDAFF